MNDRVYCYPGTDVLINTLGIHDSVILQLGTTILQSSVKLKRDGQERLSLFTVKQDH